MNETKTRTMLYQDFDNLIGQFALLYREIKENLHTGLSVTNEVEELKFQLGEIRHFNERHRLDREMNVDHCEFFMFRLTRELGRIKVAA